MVFKNVFELEIRSEMNGSSEQEKSKRSMSAFGRENIEIAD